jgi:hypothetical protein
MLIKIIEYQVRVGLKVRKFDCIFLSELSPLEDILYLIYPFHFLFRLVEVNETLGHTGYYLFTKIISS